MRTPVWAQEMASIFWEAVGDEGPFPRDLERAAESAFPVTVVRTPNLSVKALGVWFQQLGITIDAEPDRPLFGALAANRGHAALFVDSLDPIDEQRYSLAHELAHFLRDICRPRNRVQRVLGESSLEVVDGWRAPSVDERLGAALENLELTPHLHLMHRAADGQTESAHVAAAEDAAEVLACELLAPVHALSELSVSSETELAQCLVADFGLPPRQARYHARRLLPPTRRSDSWLKDLRASLP